MVTARLGYRFPSPKSSAALFSLLLCLLAASSAFVSCPAVVPSPLLLAAAAPLGSMSPTFSRPADDSFAQLLRKDGEARPLVSLYDLTRSRHSGGAESAPSFSPRVLPFETAYELQLSILNSHLSLPPPPFSPPPSSSSPPLDSLLLVTHSPVYTLGAGASLSHVLNPSAAVPVVRTSRGGEVTYHGPGQLVLYAVLDLERYRKDLRWHLRALEEVAVRSLQAAFGIEGVVRVPGRSGVFVARAEDDPKRNQGEGLAGKRGKE